MVVRGFDECLHDSNKVVPWFTTELHNNDTVWEKQNGCWSFKVVFMGTFRGNDVTVKKMKEVGARVESLWDCIRKKVVPSERMEARPMLDAAKGFAFLHSNGVIHRDSMQDNSPSSNTTGQTL